MGYITRAFLFVICLSSFVKAQDVLVLRDSSRLKGIVKEVGVEKIFYKDSLGSLHLHEIQRTDIAYLVFGQGGVLKIEDKAPLASSEIFAREPNFLLSDSLRYFEYSKSLSLNFLSFFNNELALIYQQDFFKRRMNIMVPVVVGYGEPGITQRMSSEKNIFLTMGHKWFETGIGAHFTTKYRSNFNWYAGPDFRVQVYDGTQVLLPGRANPYVRKRTPLFRSSLSLSLGLIMRTKSHWQFSMFASLGVKADAVVWKIKEPLSGRIIDPITSPYGLCAWSGCMLGYTF